MGFAGVKTKAFREGIYEQVQLHVGAVVYPMATGRIAIAPK